MEYADNSDLMKLISDKKKAKQLIPEEFIWKSLIQILAGVYFLHQHDIIHRDLKVKSGW